jgi:hypothetical protein
MYPLEETEGAPWERKIWTWQIFYRTSRPITVDTLAK